MDRKEAVDFLRSEIEETQRRLRELAADKASSDGPRTSWHSQTHLDLEGQIDRYQRYLVRCRHVLAELEENRPTGLVGAGSIVSLEIEGDIGTYLFVQNGGSAIGSYLVLSAASPIGKAVWGKRSGEKVEARAPAGTISVKILQVA